MIPFSTEFPVKASENRAAFIAEVIAWLRGMQDSTVLDAGSDRELDGGNAHLLSNSGEELRLRELKGDDNWNAIGFRHDLPDNQGRLWRTDCVLRRSAADGEENIIRLRTQCIPRVPGAHLESPRKPYLIKALLKNRWGGTDALLAVSDQPVWLEDSKEGLAIARAVTVGDAVKWLPAVYISALDKGSWLLREHEIEKLAYDLGGIAHVVVEPDREFSFHLRDATEGRNAYRGTIGLSIPGKGIVKRYYLGWNIQDEKRLAAIVKEAASMLRGEMPAFGWDWTELQERVLRKQREANKGVLSKEEIDELFDDLVKENEDLKGENQQLKEQLRDRPISAEVGGREGEFTSDNLISLIGPEVYEGEISDRLRLAAKTTLSVAEQIGLDERSKAILQRVVNRFHTSPALAELLQDLARATKDPKKLNRELTSLLSRHGYSRKSENKHTRIVANEGYDGLKPITLPKTPSDHRGLRNLEKQIAHTLGLTDLIQ